MDDPKMIGKTEKGKLKIVIMAMLLSLMLIHFTPVCAEEENDAATMEFSFKPPPEEALRVSEEKSAPPPIMPIMIGVTMVSAVLGGTLLVLKKKKLKSIRTAAIIPLIVLNLFTFTFQPNLVLADEYDFGNPLDTSNIQILTYYQEPSGWTLAEIVPAFVSYTDHGNYIDGIIRVWMDQKSPTNFKGSDRYIDIPVRVRADGWILAWLWKDQSIAYFIFWGHSRAAAGVPVIGATTLSRAIERIYYVAGKKDIFPGYEAFYLYDYTHPTANRLLIFGKIGSLTASRESSRSGSYTFYYILPANVKIVDTATSISYYEDYGSNYGRLIIDRTVVESWGSTTEWHSISLPEYALTKGTKHEVIVYLHVVGSFWWSQRSCANVAFMFWLE